MEITVALFGVLGDEMIAEKTGLSLEEIQHLKKHD